MEQGQGLRVGGRYELGELLGRGGMAEVRLGTDIRLGRTVAVKRLRTDLAADPVFQARFRREAQSAAALNHPNVVAVYDTGEEIAADGSHVQPYIVMEYVAGRTLREVLDDGRKILPERALEIVLAILDALQYSHRTGIVHRDIKPGNVMLTPSGEVKVMDFGIARAVSEGTSSVTQTQAVVGTAQYLSPEQARGETVDSRSDVYSTGCVLYELLTGRPPFIGDSPFSVAYQHVREQPEPPSQHNPDLDPALDAIVLRALAKRVEDRYPGAEAMAQDIRRFLDGEPVDATALATQVVPAAAAAATLADPTATSIFRPAEAPPAQAEPERRRSRWWIPLLLLALLAGAVAAGVALLSSDAEQVTVPDVTNRRVAAAERRLAEEGLRIGTITPRTSEEVAEGIVIDQDPGQGANVDSGSEVDLVVSAGTETVVIPNVLGMPADEAAAALAERGLGSRRETRDSDEPRGTVIETDPPVATEVDAETTVTLVLSTGPAQVPNVLGLPQDEAEARLEDAGFVVDVAYDDDTPSDPGTVLTQSPEGLAEAPRGSTVRIVVSDYEEPTPTPTPSPRPTTATPSPTPSPSPTATEDEGGGDGGGGDGGG